GSLKVFSFVCLAIVSCACNPVLSKRAVGEKPAQLAPAEWDGNWISSDGPVNLKVIDGEKGRLSASWTEEAQGRPTLKTATIEVRQQGDWLFGNTLEDGNGKSRGYLWARIWKEDRQIIVWEPD